MEKTFKEICMNKLVSSLLAVLFILSLGFCSSSEEVKEAPAPAPTEVKSEPAKDAKTPAKTAPKKK